MARRVGADGAVHALGLTFPHPLGLAAGFDKNAVGIDALAALGFGHVEIGTVTGEPQPGNPKPRLFRLPADRADRQPDGLQQRRRRGRRPPSRRPAAAIAPTRRAIGADSARHLRRLGGQGWSVGVNIGKSKVVDEGDQAAVQADYEKSAGLLAPYADYLVVNVSSPNTPGLRSLQAVDRLGPLLEAVRRRADAVTDHRVPLLVKIAPDLADDDVLAVADLATGLGLDGLIATNTTISRAGLASRPGRGRADRRRRTVRPAAHRALAGGAPAAQGPGRRRAHPGLGRRHHHARGRARPAGRGRDPAPGLHRVRLRGPAVAPAPGARAPHERGDPSARHRDGAGDPQGRCVPPPHRRRAGHRRAVPSRHLRRALGRRRQPRRRHGPPGPPVVLGAQGPSDRRPRADPGDRGRGGRPGHPVAGRAAGRDPARGDRAAGAPVLAAEGTGELRARRARPCRGAAVPPRRAAARARLRRLAGGRRGRRGAPAVRPGGPPVGARGHRRHRRRLGRSAGPGRGPPGRAARAGRADVVYAAGPTALLHAVAEAAEAIGAWSQTALEEPLVCATGLCHGCAVPVVGEDGAPRTARACVDGPVFRGDRVRWRDLQETAR